MKGLLSAIIALCACFILFSFSVDLVSQDGSYYAAQMVQNDIPWVTGRSLRDLNQISDDLRQYLREGDERILTPHFDEEEVRHMADVYALFNLMRKMNVLASILGVTALCVLSRREGLMGAFESIGRVSIILILLLLAFAGIVVANFGQAWTQFHEIFFTNDLWLMDPETDLMIQMLPEPFFFGMVKRIGLCMMAGLLVMASFARMKGDRDGIK